MAGYLDFLLGSQGAKLIQNPLASLIGDIPANFIQKRQYGGSVKPKNPYLVGEDGPEVFMPTQEGTVIPNQQNMTYPIQSIPKENYQHMQLLPNQQSNQSQPDNTINTLQSLLSLANQGKQQYLTPELNQPYLGLQGAPPSGNVMRDLGTLAAAINPKSFGGRLGAGMAGNVGEYEQDAARNLAARVGLGRYGMEQQDYQRKLSMQDALDKSKAGIMGRLNQPGGYEDYDQGMSVQTPSPMEQMNPLERAYLESELLGNNPNLSPLLKTSQPPKLSGYKTVDESGNPMYLNEYGEPTGIPAYVKPQEVEPYKIGHVMPFTVGDKTVYKQYKGKGQWETMSGVGGGRYKGTTGGSGGGVGNKDAEKYRKNVEAYNRETKMLDQQYYATLNQPQYIGNSWSTIKERNLVTDNYKKQLDQIIKKYRGKIDFVSNAPSGTTNLEKKIGNEWTEGGRKFRMNPQTGKKEMWVE